MKKLLNKLISTLRNKKLTISLAESCTGGMLSSALTSVSGSSKIFSFGLITYSEESKIKILNVSKIIISRYGAVSKEVCLAMVSNLNKISKTNISIAITGVAGPSGGTKKKPVGLVYIGIKIKNKIKIKKYLFKKKGRFYIQKNTVIESLNLILNALK